MVVHSLVRADYRYQFVEKCKGEIIVKKILFGLGIVVACIIPIAFAKKFSSPTVSIQADTVGNRLGNILQENLEEGGDVVATGNDLEVYDNEVELRLRFSKYAEDQPTRDEIVQEIIEEKAV